MCSMHNYSVCYNELQVNYALYYIKLLLYYITLHYIPIFTPVYTPQVAYVGNMHDCRDMYGYIRILEHVRRFTLLHGNASKVTEPSISTELNQIYYPRSGFLVPDRGTTEGGVFNIVVQFSFLLFFSAGDGRNKLHVLSRGSVQVGPPDRQRY